jgi:hypothetical protein
MPIVLKDAEKLWKKVKPMTLTKTGVSETLTVLKTYDRGAITDKTVEAWEKKFKKLAEMMGKHVGDAKIKKHAAAHKWLKDLDFQLAQEGNFLTHFREHQALQEKEEEERLEQERLERQIEHQNEQWTESLGKSLNKLQEMETSLQEDVVESKRILKEIKKGTYPALHDKRFPDEVGMLDGSLRDREKKRENLKKDWSKAVSEVNSSKTATTTVKKAASAVESLDTKVGALAKSVGETLKQASTAFDDFAKTANTEYGKFLQAFGTAEGTLTNLHKDVDKLIKKIDADVNLLKTNKLEGNKAARKGQDYQSELQELQSQRRKLKPSWFDTMAKAKKAAESSTDKTLEELITDVVKLDAGLRAEDGGKEGDAAEKLKPLLSAKGSGGSTGGSTSGSRPSSNQGSGPPRRKNKTPTAKEFEILGLKWPCTIEDVKKAYRPLALKWHPDKWSGKSKEDQKAAEEKFKDIANAYGAFTAYFED